MWTRVITVALTTVIVTAQVSTGPANIGITVSENVKSLGFKVVYGDEDMVIVNQVVSEAEKQSSKTKVNINSAIKPLPAMDVKCLMSVDRYCSKEMASMKNVLVQAIKEDCAKCSKQEKEEAGRVVAAMMYHDPVAWKLFLTRSALHIMKPTRRRKRELLKYREIGEPEDIDRDPENSYMMPGTSVRVRKYQSEIIKSRPLSKRRK